MQLQGKYGKRKESQSHAVTSATGVVQLSSFAALAACAHVTAGAAALGHGFGLLGFLASSSFLLTSHIG